MAVVTAYCLRGKRTASDKIVYPGCVALSRCLARQLDAKFGDKIHIEGVGIFTVDDKMPTKWKHCRVDIHLPTLKQCRVFGVKRCRVRRIG